MILGIMGQAGSGKDTIADYLVRRFGFVKVSLADPLKRICKEIYDFSDEQLWGPSEFRDKPDMRYPNGKGGFLSPRVALQTLGTEWGRKNYPNTWTKYGMRVADCLLEGGWAYDQKKGLYRPFWGRFASKPQGVVVPDIRFRNEIDPVHANRYGYVVRVRRRSATGAVGIEKHASEEEQKDILDSELDYTINNDFTMELLRTAVDHMMDVLPKQNRLRVVFGGK